VRSFIGCAPAFKDSIDDGPQNRTKYFLTGIAMIAALTLPFYLVLRYVFDQSPEEMQKPLNLR